MKPPDGKIFGGYDDLLIPFHKQIKLKAPQFQSAKGFAEP